MVGLEGASISVVWGTRVAVWNLVRRWRYRQLAGGLWTDLGGRFRGTAFSFWEVGLGTASAGCRDAPASDKNATRCGG